MKTIQEKYLEKHKKVVDFFSGAHKSIGHKRKCENLDYFDHHIMGVANTALAFGELFEIKSIGLDIIYKAALAHDYYEDVVLTKGLKKEFRADKAKEILGEEAFGAAIDLTNVYINANFPFLNRRERKLRELLRLKKINFLAKIVKLADIYENSKDDPTNIWVYEKLDLLKAFVVETNFCSDIQSVIVRDICGIVEKKLKQ